MQRRAGTESGSTAGKATMITATSSGCLFRHYDTINTKLRNATLSLVNLMEEPSNRLEGSQTTTVEQHTRL
ncbi:hypothetical protein M513_11833 [Trichuris suis]|uniref:Uncharacterized protein n=1 Tax=Trichuris suis TaxID=68888 RepID=A0A085LQN4_9BILA|nr:hypothetical protein M513_11833 [Trichuris suis]